MLEYYEVNPLPDVCVKCMENAGEDDDCYNCDFALDRWRLTLESENRLNALIRCNWENNKSD